MTLQVQAMRVRASIYCDQDSITRLKEIGNRWFQLMAAHQSNTVRDAEQSAHSDFRAPANKITRWRSNWAVQNEVDAARLRQLCSVWSDLTSAKQIELVETVKLACGEQNMPTLNTWGLRPRRRLSLQIKPRSKKRTA